jgi:hypothetical protein
LCGAIDLKPKKMFRKIDDLVVVISITCDFDESHIEVERRINPPANIIHFTKSGSKITISDSVFEDYDFDLIKRAIAALLQEATSSKASFLVDSKLQVHKGKG